MFNNPKQFFAGEETLDVDQNGSPSDADLLIATIVLLSDVAQADGIFEATERDGIFRALCSDFNIQDVQAGELFEIADFVRREKGKTDEFIAVINANFNDIQRARVLTLAWKIILADGKIEFSETEIVSDLRKQLGLSMEQAVRAQAVAQQELSEGTEP